MSITQARILRQRAERLRRLANAIEQSPVMRLQQFAGEDTWKGRRPMMCVTVLVDHQARLHGEAEDLRQHAHRFVQRAVSLEALAAAVPSQAS